MSLYYKNSCPDEQKILYPTTIQYKHCYFANKRNAQIILTNQIKTSNWKLSSL